MHFVCVFVCRVHAQAEQAASTAIAEEVERAKQPPSPAKPAAGSGWGASFLQQTQQVCACVCVCVCVKTLCVPYVGPGQPIEELSA